MIIFSCFQRTFKFYFIYRFQDITLVNLELSRVLGYQPKNFKYLKVVTIEFRKIGIVICFFVLFSGAPLIYAKLIGFFLPWLGK